MEKVGIENLVFTYPNQEEPCLNDVSFIIKEGEFVTLCGESGCGKSTLLKQFGTCFPHGKREGKIYFEGNLLENMTQREKTENIGFVQQSPENQIVTDKVWHELAFGLESLGYSTTEIRSRVAEMASFFGIQTWFHKKTTELSGGQKQILNLASVMVMQPSILILDEPTSQLDPIASTDFLGMLKKINQELGTTILLTEHRLEEALPLSDRVLVMDCGSLIANGTPTEVGNILKTLDHNMFLAMPAPMKIHANVPNDLKCPITVREGRGWIQKMTNRVLMDTNLIPKDCTIKEQSSIIELEEVWFRYERELPDIVKGLSVTIKKGEFFALVGGNGTGKTTSLSIMSGMLVPYRGSVKIEGVLLSKNPNLQNKMGVLPQNPQTLFVMKTVRLDLLEMVSDRELSKEEREQRIKDVVQLCELENLLSMHPYDLSGGEQQRVALAKILLLNPNILFLDEPTKGLDAHFKEKLASILKNLQSHGVTIVMVSHDIEFCARHTTRCAMFFDGSITSMDTPRNFFGGKNFYTTSTNRIARKILPNAILFEDVILACGGTILPKKKIHKEEDILIIKEKEEKYEKQLIMHKKITPFQTWLGLIAFLSFGFTQFYFYKTGIEFSLFKNILLLLLFVIGCVAFFPRNKDRDFFSNMEKNKPKLSKRTLLASVLGLFLIPLTIYIGMIWLENRKYYFISLLILLETTLPFVIRFEGRKPKARELVVIAVLCGIAVAGRVAFFMLPQFKPVLAIVIITGVCFGGETGFLVGGITAFVSNMIFGQGTWTPWQMFGFGICGFLSGILSQKGFLRKQRGSLSIFGALVTFFICGFILDTGSALMWQTEPTFQSMIPYYITGISFNIIHAIATAFFLWFIAEPMIEKLDRIKQKYGLIES